MEHEHHDRGASVPELVEGHEHHASTDSATGHEHDHHDHSAHDPAQFGRKFWLSLVLTIPTLVFSTGLQDILNLSGPRFPGSEFIPAAFGLVIFFYGGWVFLTGAVSELRAKQPGMMTLIALAILVAFGYSVAVTLGLHGMDFWWELATLITIMLLGHWIEMSAIMGAQDALGELAKLIPDEAELVHGDSVPELVEGGHGASTSSATEGSATETVPVSQLKVDDHVLVRPGASIPADGEVIEGESEVNESLLTGESTTVSKSVGAQVIAGSTNGSGSLTLRVTRVGADTALAGVMKLVADAQASKSGAQVLADRAAGWLFYVSVGAAILTAIVWVLIKPGDPTFVLERIVTVLVIACPHALGLAIPLVAQISTAIGARHGLLVRSRSALEDARNIQVVLFDKTGTLTEGRQGIDHVVPIGDVTEDELVQLGAAVEARSEHPIARAIVRAAADKTLRALRSSRFVSIAGRGAEATVDGKTVTVASARVLTERGIAMDVALVHASKAAAAEGQTVVYVVREDSVLGMISLADVIRAESVQAVEMLKARGIRVAMLTGDSHEVANWVGARLGITEIFSEVLPGEKADVVERLQQGGTSVAMVGDGVNDAPALARADVGIAIGAGTDVAIESAGIVLAGSDPRGVADILKLSRATYRKMQQNLFWGTAYNVVGIPLAAGVLYGAGILLAPALGALFMSVSTIVVALNAQLLRRIKLEH